MLDVHWDKNNKNTTQKENPYNKIVHTPEYLGQEDSVTLLAVRSDGMGCSLLPFPGGEEYLRQGVSYCVNCELETVFQMKFASMVCWVVQQIDVVGRLEPLQSRAHYHF